MTQLNLFREQKQIHRHRGQTGACQGGGERDGLGIWDANYYTQGGWTTRPYCVAPRSIFNVLWWSIIKKYLKELLYVQPRHFSVQQKLTQHCKSTTLQWNKLKQKKRPDAVQDAEGPLPPQRARLLHQGGKYWYWLQILSSPRLTAGTQDQSRPSTSFHISRLPSSFSAPLIHPSWVLHSLEREHLAAVNVLWLISRNIPFCSSNRWRFQDTS